MDFTVTISEKFNVLPFEILKQDKDEVIMVINYYIQKGENAPEETNVETKSGKSVKRVRVNDDTATGGWF